MPFERKLWNRRFLPQQPPAFPCPRCDGLLVLIPDSSRVEETNYSKLRDLRDGGYPISRFTCTFRCSNNACGEVVAAHGVVDHEQVPIGGLTFKVRELFAPKGMSPAPPIIRITEDIPIKVANKLKLAFELYWVDLDACANAIRSSVERILDHMKIPIANLSNRIEAYKKVDPHHAESFEALRHVGNVGSHEGNVPRETVLDAFEIYDDVLRKLFYGEDRIGALRRRIISRKGK